MRISSSYSIVYRPIQFLTGSIHRSPYTKKRNPITSCPLEYIWSLPPRWSFVIIHLVVIVYYWRYTTILHFDYQQHAKPIFNVIQCCITRSHYAHPLRVDHPRHRGRRQRINNIDRNPSGVRINFPIPNHRHDTSVWSEMNRSRCARFILSLPCIRSKQQPPFVRRPIYQARPTNYKRRPPSIEYATESVLVWWATPPGCLINS